MTNEDVDKLINEIMAYLENVKAIAEDGLDELRSWRKEMSNNAHNKKLDSAD